MHTCRAAQLPAYLTHWLERQTSSWGCSDAPPMRQTWALTSQKATRPGPAPEAGGRRVQPAVLLRVWHRAVGSAPAGRGGVGAALTDPPALLSSCSLRTPSTRPPRWPHHTLDAGGTWLGLGGLTTPPPEWLALPLHPLGSEEGLLGHSQVQGDLPGTAVVVPAHAHTRTRTCTHTHTHWVGGRGRGVAGGGGLDKGVAMRGQPRRPPGSNAPAPRRP